MDVNRVYMHRNKKRLQKSTLLNVLQCLKWESVNNCKQQII